MQSTAHPFDHPFACQIKLVDRKGEYLFSSSDIIRLEASNSYTVVYFEKRRPFVASKVLKTYEELLAPYGFVRTHRSHLVNKQYVHRIEKSSIIMQDASIAELRKKKKTKIIRQLK